MKYTLLAAALLVLAGCHTIDSILDPIPPHGRPRGVWNLRDTSRAGSSDHGSGQPPGKALYVTAVEYPEGYAWASDTLFGTSGASIDLFRDGKLVLSVPTGHGCCVSPDPDMHHFLNGHLYTEYSDLSRTYIGRDGERLFSYEGCEMVKGLIEAGGDLYTLGLDRSGAGISLRRNGELEFRRAGCVPCGDLYVQSYDPSGALYMDEGKLCFGFMDPVSGEWFLYCEGSVEKLPVVAAKVYDVRRVGGSNCVLSRSGTILNLSAGTRNTRVNLGNEIPQDDFRIVNRKGRALFYGTVTVRYGADAEVRVWSEDGLMAVFEGRGGWIFDWDDFSYCVAQNRLGRIVAYNPEYGEESFTDPFYMPSYRCVSLTDNGIAMALTPSGSNATPYIHSFKSDTPVGINGFLTGIYWE